ncbi:MAG: protein kinase [Phycisphaerae bacterium]|nr:protein kinase [Phycisphaerae bacterium]
MDHHRPTTTADERCERIERVLAELTGQVGQCDAIDFRGVEREHPELMPDLGERLRLLEGIHKASLAVRQQELGSPVDDSTADLADLEKALPGYDILERLRYGGQGVVYRAFQRSTERMVAIKVLLDGLLVSPRQQRRFVREVRLASRLHHPNIVGIYEAGIVSRRPYYVMEFVDGVALDDYILLHGLDARQTVALIVKVCHAVHSAHQRGIIHRDLKPSNILVDDQGEPRVLDFGLAKLIAGDGDSDEDLSLAGRVVGTLPYLSPEQATSDDGQVDIRTDVYALGVILYQALTDQFPYPVSGPAHRVLANIAAREPASLRKLLRGRVGSDLTTARGANDDLERVVLKALAKNPNGRYQSMESLAVDLERFLRGEAVAAKAHHRLYQLRKAARRFRWPLLVASAFVIVILLAQWAVFRAEQRRREDARLAALGLDLGGLVRLGADYQKEGDADKALALFQTALQLSPDEPELDAAAAFRFDALYRSATAHYENRRPEEARPYADQAEVLAERLIERDPNNPQWRRFRAIAATLRAEDAFASKNWVGCVEHLNEAVHTMHVLRNSSPGNTALDLDLVRFLCRRATCLMKEKELPRAFADARLSREILLPLYNEDVQDLNYAIELAVAEASLAVLNMTLRTTEGNARASEWLDSAESRIRAIQALPDSEGRAWSISRLMDSIQANRKILAKRLAASQEGR